MYYTLEQNSHAGLGLHVAVAVLGVICTEAQDGRRMPALLTCKTMHAQKSLRQR